MTVPDVASRLRHAADLTGRTCPVDPDLADALRTLFDSTAELVDQQMRDYPDPYEEEAQEMLLSVHARTLAVADVITGGRHLRSVA